MGKEKGRRNTRNEDFKRDFDIPERQEKKTLYLKAMRPYLAYRETVFGFEKWTVGGVQRLSDQFSS